MSDVMYCYVNNGQYGPFSQLNVC